MSNPLHNALEDIKKKFLTYSMKVEENVHLALQSFLKTNLQNLEKVKEAEKQIDQIEVEIEEACLNIIAMYQPLARDLRFLLGVIKMNNDLERIGDLAVSIVKKVPVFSDQDLGVSEVSFFLPEMVEKVENMLRKSLDSFSKQDADLAKKVCEIDDEVDDLNNKMKVLIFNKMREGSIDIEPLMSILSNASHLERIADLSTNIAEDVIYWVKGDIVRHGGEST